MPCCLDNHFVSGADLAEADPSRIGAALGAILRRPLRRMDVDHIDETKSSSQSGGGATLAPARPSLAL